MNDVIAHFHFLRPYWFLLMLPLLTLLYMQWKQRADYGAWRKVVAPELLTYLESGSEQGGSNQRAGSSVTLFLAGMIAITALAGPVWKELPMPVYKQQSALVILVDLSQSMNATDIKPSRLVRAKQKIRDLLALRKEGQTALVAFAGTAYTVSPLTEDTQTIASQLSGLTTDIMPVQGGDVDSGLSKAMELFTQASVLHGDVLLVTDSDSFSTDKLNALVTAGHRLHVIGVGTEGGAPIASGTGGFLKDSQGNIVIPQLHTDLLQQLARAGHGEYHALSLDDSDIASVLPDAMSHAMNDAWDDVKQSDELQKSDQWREEGPWLLLLLIPLLLFSFRKGALFALLLCVWLQPQPADAGAWTDGLWRDLWQTREHQGRELMDAQQYDKAAKTFEDPSWKAGALYRNQDYENAVKALEHAETADDLYNKGNALARLGKFEEAIQAYDESLKQNPDNEDAKANKELIEKLMQQQEQQDSKDSQQSEKNSDKDKSEQQQGENSQQQSEQQQSEDQQSQQSQDQQQQGQQGQQSQNNQNQDTQDNQSQESQSQQDQAEQDKQQEEEKQSQAAKEKQAEDNQPEEKQQQVMQRTDSDLEQQASKQAFEQSLRRVPDDPSGLLRRKFMYQYQQQNQQNQRQQKGAQQW